jgi:hypothetical protein
MRLLPLIALALAGCTTSSLTRSTKREWWPNGEPRTSESITRGTHNQVTTDAAQQADKILGDVGGLWDKYGAPATATALSMLGLGGVVGVAKRRAQRQDDERWEADAERKRAEEYAAGVLAGRAGGTV